MIENSDAVSNVWIEWVYSTAVLNDNFGLTGGQLIDASTNNCMAYFASPNYNLLSADPETRMQWVPCITGDVSGPGDEALLA